MTKKITTSEHLIKEYKELFPLDSPKQWIKSGDFFEKYSIFKNTPASIATNNIITTTNSKK